MGLVRALIVDDSAFVRKSVRAMLSRSPLIDVVGLARNGQQALELVETLKPDVVTCDLLMPELDGVGFVKEQMARRPVPILILTASPQDAGRVVEALDAGAVDFVQKPTALATEELNRICDELIGKVKAAAHAHSRALVRPAAPMSAASVHPLRLAANVDIVVLGISTGGPQALRFMLPQFAADFPVPLVMVLHMPVGYTSIFAQKLAEISSLAVKEAFDGCAVEPGQALLAPAGLHSSFRRSLGDRVSVQLSVNPLDKPHRPSVDVLFQSAAEVYGKRVLGVVMTGMGDDGKQGAAWIKAKGGTILTESESSCVIYGMPRAVVEAGLSDGTAQLGSMVEAINRRL